MKSSYLSLVVSGIVGACVVLGADRYLNKTHSFIESGTSNDQKNSNFRNVSNNSAPEGIGFDFVKATEVSMPCVVHITSSEEFQARSMEEQHIYNFFGQPAPQKSTGSGVIINKNGYIVTNNHVIAGATSVEIMLYDKRKFQAEVIGTDPSTDLAVLKINEGNLPAIEFANSDETKVGQWVLAVGNPFQLTSTATAGIISAKGRSIDIISGPDRPVESFIQTDAAINPGNSGGALVNTEGKLVGINTAIFSKTGTYAGYAFAVPSNLVKKVVSDFISHGTVQRAAMGIEIVSLDKAREHVQLNSSITSGVYIKNVIANGGAAQAGIKPGDIVVSIDGKKVTQTSELLEKIASRNKDEVVKVLVNRNGSDREFQVRLN